MSQIKIPWWEPKIGKKEYDLIKEALDNHFPNEGHLTERFEKELSELLKCKYIVAVNNGTVAMFLSLKALDIGAEDEVIVPDLTFIATANAVEMTGARPILVDINKKNLTIDTKAFESAINGKTKAVIPVHVSGRGADMKDIKEIADKENIYVVEDAAEAFTSKHNNKCLGTFGKTGCFSFSPHKTITMGQGGAIATEDKNLYVRLLELKDQGRPVRGTGGDDRHDVIGYNFKFTDLQAAVGLGQLTYLKERVERIKRTYKLYAENLRDLNGISLFNFDVNNGEIPQWIDASAEKRDDLDKYLRDNGIDCRRFWLPVHTQKPYKYAGDNFPNALEMSKKALWLPSAYTLTDDDIDEVCSHIKKFLKMH